jgi:uncharacterized membrane protein YedE/YeeE
VVIELIIILVAALMFGFGALALLLLFVAFLFGPPEAGSPQNDDARMMSVLAPYNRRFGPLLMVGGLSILLIMGTISQ